MSSEPKLDNLSSTHGHILRGNSTNKRTLEDHNDPIKTDKNNNNLVLSVPGESTMDTIQVDSKQDKPVSCIQKLFSWRYAMVILLHLSFLVATFARNCMSIALVCMTHTKPQTDETANMSLVNATYKEVFVEEVFKEFSWDTGTQGLILSSASFLAFLAPLIANFIQPYFGHKNTLTAMTLVTVLTLFLTPIASRTSPWFLVCLRTILGGTFGANVPTVGDSIARWAPRMEKQTMITIVYAGLQTGGLFCSLISGYLCLIPIDNGWPFIFYIIGAIICVWIVFWHFFCSVNPEDHKYISEKELQYIKQNRVMKEPGNKKETQRPPYKTILTSAPVIAVLVCTALHYWSILLIFTYMPIYFAAVLGFSVTETGVLMTCIAAARFVGMILITLVVNTMMGQNKWSPTYVKKFNMAYGTIVSAATYIPAITMGSDQRWVIIGFFMVSMVFQSIPACILPGVPLDLAPRYAGFITGLSFSLGGLLSISAPLVAAGLTPNNTAEEWQNVWIVGAALFGCILLISIIFGDCRLQPWATENGGNSPEIVSPFDPMTKSFAADMATPPILPVEVSQVREMDLVVEHEVAPSPGVFTTENSSSIVIHSSDRTEETSTELDGVFNDGFESELDRSIPPLKENTHQLGGNDGMVVVRF